MLPSHGVLYASTHACAYNYCLLHCYVHCWKCWILFQWWFPTMLFQTSMVVLDMGCFFRSQLSTVGSLADVLVRCTDLKGDVKASSPRKLTVESWLPENRLLSLPARWLWCVLSLTVSMWGLGGCKCISVLCAFVCAVVFFCESWTTLLICH